MEETVPDSMFEEREELMVSSTGENVPTRRQAHFLKPILSSLVGEAPSPHSLCSFSVPLSFEPETWPLKVYFRGWGYPTPGWISWVYRLHNTYESVWKQAGIYEAIMSSTSRIRRTDDLIIGIAEKWCPNTNTFIFPWGEATVTLEDMMILGGYSVIGYPISLATCCVLGTDEFKKIENKLKEARVQLLRGSNSQKNWMMKFVDREMEHEAFLSLWLSRFVLSDSDKVIKDHVFPVAILLSRGIRFALAPAVLSSIYRDLRLLKETIVALAMFETGEGNECLEISLHSSLRFVQLWIWERFVDLHPKSNAIKHGDPITARWHKVEKLNVDNVRLVLDTASESFLWRPYAVRLNGWNFPKFYIEKEEWVHVDKVIEEDTASFALCMRASELVGLNSIEQYLPHRVALQFGMDQDIPGNVSRYNNSPELAWSNFMRPFSDDKFYFPSRLFESDVTIRYLNWWKKSWLDFKDFTRNVVQRKRSLRRKMKFVSLASLTPDQVPRDAMSKYQDKIAYPTGFPTNDKFPTNNKLEAAMEKKGDNDAEVPLGFPPKCIQGKLLDFDEELKFSTGELSQSCNRHNSFFDAGDTDGSCYANQGKCNSTSAAADNRDLKGQTGNNGVKHACFTPNKVFGDAMERQEGNDPDVPPGFPPKIMQLRVEDSVNEVECTTGQVLRSFDRHHHSASDGAAGDVRSYANPEQGYSISAAADNRALKGKLGDDTACFTHNKVLEAATERKGDVTADVPPGFPPKTMQVKVKDFVEELESCAVEPLRSFCKHRSVADRAVSDRGFYTGWAQCHSTSAVADNEVLKDAIGKNRDGHINFTRTQVLEAAIVKKGDSDVVVPLGFASNSTQEKVGDFSAEVLESFDEQHILADRAVADNMSDAGHAQFHSTSAPADDGALKDKDLQTTIMKKTPDINASVGGQVKAMNDENGSMKETPVYEVVDSDEDGGEISTFKIETLGLKLEARIARLEKVFAELKTAKFRRMSANNRGKESFSIVLDE